PTCTCRSYEPAAPGVKLILNPSPSPRPLEESPRTATVSASPAPVVSPHCCPKRLSPAVFNVNSPTCPSESCTSPPECPAAGTSKPAPQFAQPSTPSGFNLT